MNLKVLAVLGLTLPLLGACGGGSRITADYNLVRIVSAQYADGTPIPEVQVLGVPSSVTSGGIAQPSQNVRYGNGGELWCTVACAFGPAGRYTVTASAPGAVPQQIAVNIPAHYVKERGFAGTGDNRYTGTPQEVRLVFERE